MMLKIMNKIFILQNVYLYFFSGVDDGSSITLNHGVAKNVE